MPDALGQIAATGLDLVGDGVIPVDLANRVLVDLACEGRDLGSAEGRRRLLERFEEAVEGIEREGKRALTT